MGKKRNKIILPPQLPPDVADDDVEISDEDVEFLKQNKAYTGFLKNLDTKTINRHVVRVANQKEDDLESLYEKRNKKSSLQTQAEEDGLKVDPVDVLPVKTLDGQLYYRTASKSEKSEKEEGTAIDSNPDEKDKDIVKLTKAEKRAKLKKIRKEAKRQAKEQISTDPVEEAVHSEVLAEVKEELSSEEAFQRKKSKLAEVGLALLADPEANIKSLKEMLKMCEDEDHNIVRLGILSLLAIFKDIIPGYRIRLPTQKELEMTVSKTVRKTRFYESTLLSSYKAYLQKLISFQKQPSMKHVTVRCMCNLLDAVPHFNFYEILLAFVVKNLSSSDDFVRKLCCSSLKSLFANEGKHGGQATVEAVQLITDLVKMQNCQLHPNCVEVFLSLSFDEDLGKSRSSKKDEKFMHKKTKRRQNDEAPDKVPISEKKKSKKELMAKTREEVVADFKSTSFVPDQEEKIRMQSETLSAVFQTYFRVLKSCMEPATSYRSKINNDSLPSGFGGHPLLAPCLKGLGKFSHLIDLDFMDDLMKTLKLLADGRGIQDNVSPENSLSVTERLQCCIIAFKVMRNNLDALNVDLQEFFVQLYNLLIEYNPERENQGEVVAEALKIMLCEGRQHDMQRAAAFVKRLATFCLCFGSAEAMADECQMPQPIRA
ncbi:nucleolar complex-associated protein 3 isoform X2 [Aristolochia californica]|uniref:nucleolar complex-associated protein 3 isoform X2 n=1 Tax=Aristolochia californica TaxID=171875 RepID=UPI0035D80E4E